MSAVEAANEDETSGGTFDVTLDRVAIERHRRGNRWMHWINFPLLTIMIWSGLRIYWADLRDPFGVGIGGWHWFDLFPDWVNDRLGLERKLARGMAFHFTFGWLFVLNGLAFALYVARTGGWKNFIPTRFDLGQIPAVLKHEIGRGDAPPQGKYNGVQQLVYGTVLLMGGLAVLSGFAIYKPTQLAPLTSAFGGYESARFVHFWITIGFIVFFVVHLLQVARAGFKVFWSMFTGYELVDVPPPVTDSIHDDDEVSS
jgi:thiosulfate reductase cytochrome b subunit